MTQEVLKSRLQSAYPEASVEVFDLSGTGSKFEVEVHSAAFKGLSRVQQHQHVMAVFKAELATGELHALSIKTKIKDA